MKEKKRLREENRIFREFLEKQKFDISNILGVSKVSSNLVSMVAIKGFGDMSDFNIGKYPITQEQYISIMGKNPSYFTQDDQLPVETVSWYDAVEFCNRLSLKEGKEPAYIYGVSTTDIMRKHAAGGYRLPTANEWEYAAKGGQSFKYSGSDNLDDVGWYAGNSNSRTHPVGMKKPNAYGLYDMSGNVWEWCGDKEGNSYRVLRGGSFINDANYASVSYRYNYNPSLAFNFYGFRVVSGSR